MHQSLSGSQKNIENLDNKSSSFENILDTSSPWSMNSNISDKCRKYLQMYETCLSETTFTCQDYMDKIQKSCNDSK